MAETVAPAGSEARAPGRPPKKRITTQLWFWVLIGITLGIVVGLVAPDFAKQLKILADLFIQLIKVVIAPVIFCTVIVGIASLGNLARAGGLALRALGYFFVATVIALFIGLLAGNVFQPGAGFAGQPSQAQIDQATKSVQTGGQESGFGAFLQSELFPTSFLQPFVDNKVLQVLVLAILTACSISYLSTRMRERAVAAIDGIAKVIFGIIKIIMWAAPLAAFGGMAYTVAAFGVASLGNLGKLMLVFWGTCAFFVLVVLGIVSALAGFNVLKLIRLVKDELLIILGTSSSETVLPRLLTKLESAGASRQTVGLVIPTGYSFNLDGTCIYLTLGALFIIQAGGEQLGIGAQIALATLMVLTSKGAAGVTGAGLVTLAASLQAFGGEFFTPQSIALGIAVIVGIDRVMSEGRALTNAIGNCVATMVIARWNGELDRERLAAVLDDPSLVEDDMELHHGGGDEEGTVEGRHAVVLEQRTTEDGVTDGTADGTAGGDRTREPATRT
jgi:aerobic C4-dicarboxylate transport protein